MSSEAPIPTSIKVTNDWYRKKLNKLDKPVWRLVNTTIRVYSHLKISYIELETGRSKCTDRGFEFVQFRGDQYFTLYDKNFTFDALVENYGGYGSKGDCVEIVSKLEIKLLKTISSNSHRQKCRSSADSLNVSNQS